MLLTNLAAGTRGPVDSRAIANVLNDFGIDCEIQETPAAKLHGVARRRLSRVLGFVIAAGGDGTISAVAGAVAGNFRRSGCYPSRNA